MFDEKATVFLLHLFDFRVSFIKTIRPAGLTASGLSPLPAGLWASCWPLSTLALLLSPEGACPGLWAACRSTGPAISQTQRLMNMAPWLWSPQHCSLSVPACPLARLPCWSLFQWFCDFRKVLSSQEVSGNREGRFGLLQFDSTTGARYLMYTQEMCHPQGLPGDTIPSVAM